MTIWTYAASISGMSRTGTFVPRCTAGSRGSLPALMGSVTDDPIWRWSTSDEQAKREPSRNGRRIGHLACSGGCSHRCGNPRSKS